MYMHYINLTGRKRGDPSLLQREGEREGGREERGREGERETGSSIVHIIQAEY